MKKRLRDGKSKDRGELQVNVEIHDPEIADLFRRYMKKEVMPNKAATGNKIFTQFLREQSVELAKYEPATL